MLQLVCISITWELANKVLSGNEAIVSQTISSFRKIEDSIIEKGGILYNSVLSFPKDIDQKL